MVLRVLSFLWYLISVLVRALRVVRSRRGVITSGVKMSTVRVIITPGVITPGVKMSVVHANRYTFFFMVFDFCVAACTACSALKA